MPEGAAAYQIHVHLTGKWKISFYSIQEIITVTLVGWQEDGGPK